MKPAEALGHLATLQGSNPTFGQIVEVYERTPAVRRNLHVWLRTSLDLQMLRAAERRDVLTALGLIEDREVCSRLIDWLRHVEPGISICEAARIATLTSIDDIAAWALRVMQKLTGTSQGSASDAVSSSLRELLGGHSLDKNRAHDMTHFERVALNGKTRTARIGAADALIEAHHRTIQANRPRRDDNDGMQVIPDREPEWDERVDEPEYALRLVVEIALINLYSFGPDEEIRRLAWAYVNENPVELTIGSEWWLATVMPEEVPEAVRMPTKGLAKDAFKRLLGIDMRLPNIMFAITAAFARSEEVAMVALNRLLDERTEEDMLLAIGQSTMHQRVKETVRDALNGIADDLSPETCQWLLTVTTDDEELADIRASIERIQRSRSLVEAVVQAFGGETQNAPASTTNEGGSPTGGYFDRVVTVDASGRVRLLPTLICR